MLLPGYWLERLAVLVLHGGGGAGPRARGGWAGGGEAEEVSDVGLQC